VNLLATPRRRRFLFFALYLSEGAPIGYIWWHLPTRLRADGVPIERITALTAMLVLPWTLKFLWAPLVDTLRSSRWSFRHWIMATQVLMGLALLPLGTLDPATQLPAMAAVLLVHAVAAATQDVAIDALAISTTPPGERGAINGWMQAGMLLGRSLFGGVALMVAARFGPGAVRTGLIVTIWSSLVLLVFARESDPAPAESHGSFRAALGAALRERRTWIGLLFAATGGAAFEAVGAVAGPYLIDRGYTSAAVGRFLALPVVGAMLAGALAGGWLADRLGRARAAGIFLVAIAAVVLGLAAAHGAGGTVTLVLLAALYLAIGLFTAASYGLFMDLTLVRLGATQFSSYMAATNLCESWAGFTVGRLTAAFGYAPAFGVMALASLAALPLLGMLRRR